MELYIYNRSLDLIGLIDVFDSLRWRRRYFQPGEFELHLKYSAENIKLLEEDNIIARRDACEAGIIEGISIDKVDLTVKGRFLSSLTERRIIVEYHSRTCHEDTYKKYESNTIFGVGRIKKLYRNS